VVQSQVVDQMIQIHAGGGSNPDGGGILFSSHPIVYL